MDVSELLGWSESISLVLQWPFAQLRIAMPSHQDKIRKFVKVFD